jgi:hypothetical protein
MKLFNDKKAITINIIIICITLISLIELYFAYRIFKDYEGIYQVQIFIPLAFQSFLYKELFKNHKTHFKLRIILTVLISLVLPLLIYFTLPTYTYSGGKQIIKQYVKSNENIVFTDITYGENSVPIVNNPKRLFVDNRAYYYEIKSTGGNKYFMVNPITGKVTQLSESYWQLSYK